MFITKNSQPTTHLEFLWIIYCLNNLNFIIEFYCYPIKLVLYSVMNFRFDLFSLNIIWSSKFNLELKYLSIQMKSI